MCLSQIECFVNPFVSTHLPQTRWVAILDYGHPFGTAEETSILLGAWESVCVASFYKTISKVLYLALAFAVGECSLRFFLLVLAT